MCFRHALLRGKCAPNFANITIFHACYPEKFHLWRELEPSGCCIWISHSIETISASFDRTERKIWIWKSGKWAQNLCPGEIPAQSSWRWWLGGVSGAGFRAVALSPLLYSVPGNFALMVSKTALYKSEWFGGCGLAAGLQQVSEERLGREAGVSPGQIPLLKPIYPLLRCGGDSFLRARARSGAGAHSLSHFPATQNSPPAWMVGLAGQTLLRLWGEKCVCSSRASTSGTLNSLRAVSTGNVCSSSASTSGTLNSFRALSTGNVCSSEPAHLELWINLGHWALEMSVHQSQHIWNSETLRAVSTGDVCLCSASTSGTRKPRATAFQRGLEKENNA